MPCTGVSILCILVGIPKLLKGALRPLLLPLPEAPEIVVFFILRLPHG